MMERWLQHYQAKQKQDERTSIGVFAGKVGLFSNLLLFFMKLIAGLLAGSVSILADAMNNLADGASSVLTLFGFHAAAKPPDKEHPYGHERSEYISGLVISIVIIFVGLQFLITSVEKILNPTDLKMSPLVFLLLIVSIVAKVAQGSFYKKAARHIKSNTLDSAAQDSFNDTYITLVVIGAALVETWTGWQIDGFAGTALAVFIVYSGMQMIRKSVDDLLGTRPSEEELLEMKALLDQLDSIVGYHDLLVHNYGPNKTFATIDIEIDERWPLNEAHELIDKLEKDFKEQLGVELVCHIDPIAIHNEKHNEVYRQVKEILRSYQLNLKFHDFRIEENGSEPTIHFDVVIPEEIELTNDELYAAIEVDIHQKVGNHSIEITFDRHDLLKELDK